MSLSPSTMKLFLFILLAVAAVTAETLTDEQKARWKKWSSECQAESGISAETVTKIRNNQIETVDDKVKAHSLCFAKKSGLIKESGEIDTGIIRAGLARSLSDSGKIEEEIKLCAIKKSTQEDTAYELYRCLRKNNPTFVPV